MSLRPLDGFIVGITADRRWEEQAELLSGQGATVLHGPAVAVRRRDLDSDQRPVTVVSSPADEIPALRLLDAACNGDLDAVTFTSAPAVRNLFAIARRHGREDELRAACNDGTVAACVGPACAQVTRQLGVATPLTPPVARLGALVRAVAEVLSSRRRTVGCGGTTIVIQGSAVEVGGRVVNLSPRERAVLDLLSRRPGAVVSRTALLRHGWGSTPVGPHALEVAVARLRRRLGPAGLGIAAVHGRGYRLA
ncbi:MAG: winged helix-turn-helix domain-containing protein [Acidimicrobiales bacterium]